jgi:phage-related protein
LARRGGEQPIDFKAFPTIGAGVEELPIRDESGAYRVMYTARLADAVYVLHVFRKKARKTAQSAIDLAKARYDDLMRNRK